MNRRRFILWSGAAAGWPLAVLSQQAKVRRMGWFEPGKPTTAMARRKAFFAALGTAGFVEGKNLDVNYRYGHGKPDTYPAIAMEIVALKPECIIGVGVDVLRALRQATSTIPIVMGTIDADPVKEGLVASMARPGGNITGLAGIAWELAGKRLELLREVAPKITRLAVVTDTRSPAAQAHLQETEAAAQKLKLEVRVHEVTDVGSIERAFRGIRETRADALFVINVGAVNSHRPQIIQHATAMRLPAIYSNIESVDDGGLMGYSPDLVDQFRRAAVYVEKILKGAKPGELPIEQARGFELVVNLTAAKKTGITIPKSILGRADRVIE